MAGLLLWPLGRESRDLPLCVFELFTLPFFFLLLEFVHTIYIARNRNSQTNWLQ